MLEEEYQRRRRLPAHLRKPAPPLPVFSYEIRSATASDLPDVREVYNHYVMNSTVTFDETRMTLARWRGRFSQLERMGMPFLVAVSPSGQVLGYALVEPVGNRRSSRTTVEDSIYLGAASTGKGLGRALLVALIGACREAGIREVIAVIADQGADASIRLHASLGFTESGRMGRVGWKFGRWLGTVTMQLTLKPTERPGLWARTMRRATPGAAAPRPTTPAPAPAAPPSR
ncbi:GNAT family N-acetyltransferase [Clavibacter michiganensis]|uniref:N-acetyltransferase n=1 Tax=Clavibacter michiganensis subsp. insidiosus TaxID=33014 RepID=A0A399N830_9MICO|nr:GNAT family N-acetyltransferase [Clavibacter michiganensis]AWG00900.1 phosphinothricin acetyltransferase [Clavibacter michiganensis subsp. insidiosus]OQJ60515.1 N-acetyltransferase family protein [Clavibacter michiganensis subsp. insidiosus]RII89026.1 N-acetyltransferase [Clavibacter michiganensis subsp. insidiosus]RIJ43765.1 N-acetyltransferase [Clavibacter michiganensis subsp. insidiosus]RMC87226.1 N-acetyltransferase [Clavibacter michiganensis subsp. insidiosus]